MLVAQAFGRKDMDDVSRTAVLGDITKKVVSLNVFALLSTHVRNYGDVFSQRLLEPAAALGRGNIRHRISEQLYLVNIFWRAILRSTLRAKMKETDPHLLSNLPTYNDEGSVNAVVENPKVQW